MFYFQIIYVLIIYILKINKSIMFKQNLFLILFLVISCSQSTEDKQSPEATYIRLAEDLQVLADATSFNEKELKVEKKKVLDEYVTSLNGSNISTSCQVTNIFWNGATPESLGGALSDFFRIAKDDYDEFSSGLKFSEDESKENMKYWEIKCIQPGKIDINYKLKMHESLINDDELKIIKGLSEGDRLVFDGIVTSSDTIYLELYLDFKNLLWIEPGVKDSKKIFIN